MIARGLAISQLAAWASHWFPVVRSTQRHHWSLVEQVGAVSRRLMAATLRDVTAATKPTFDTLAV